MNFSLNVLKIEFLKTAFKKQFKKFVQQVFCTGFRKTDCFAKIIGCVGINGKIALVLLVMCCELCK